MSEPEGPDPALDPSQQESQAPKPIEKIKADNEKLPEKAKLEQEKTFEKVKSDHEKLPEKIKPEVEKLHKGEIEKIKPDKEKVELKEQKIEKIEKIEIKEHKNEKIEIKEHKLDIEKTSIPEKGVQEVPQTPSLPIDRETLKQHAEALENMGRQLRHFIEQSERPDLSRGALRNEPDQED